MSGQMWKLDTPDKLAHFNEYATQAMIAGKPITAKLLKEDSTTNQNAMQHKLYSDIAEQLDDQSIREVRNHCKLHYGVGILKGVDPEFATMYDKTIKPMTYEQKLDLMTYMDITSRKEFGKAQMSDYLDTIIREYTKQGIALAL